MGRQTSAAIARVASICLPAFVRAGLASGYLGAAGLATAAWAGIALNRLWAHQPRLLHPPGALAAAALLAGLAVVVYGRLGRGGRPRADRLAALALVAAPLSVPLAGLAAVLHGGRWGHWLLQELPAQPSGAAALAAAAVLVGHVTASLALALASPEGSSEREAGGHAASQPEAGREPVPRLQAPGSRPQAPAPSTSALQHFSTCWARLAPWSLAAVWLAVASSSSPGGWLLTVGFTGALLARRVAGERDLVGLLALAVPLGLTAYGLLANLLAYLMPARDAFWWTQLLLVAAGTPLLVWGRRGEAIIWSGSWESRLVVLLTAAGTYWTIGSVALAIHEYDDWYLHRPLVSFIGTTRFPLLDPYSVETRLGYHYGFDLLAAAAVAVGNLEPWQAIDLLTPWLAAAGFLLAFHLGRQLLAGVPGGGALPAYLGALLLTWGGNLRWTLLFGEYQDASPANLGSYMRETADRLLSIAGNPVTLNTPFRGAAYFSYPENMHHHASALAFPLLLASLLLWWRLRQTPRAALAALAGCVLGFLALSAETLLAMLLAGLGLHAGRQFVRGRLSRRLLLCMAGAVGLAVTLALLQGGVLTDKFVFGGPSYQRTDFLLRLPPGMPRFGGEPPVAVGSPGWLRFYVLEFGLSLVLWPAAVALLTRWLSGALSLLGPPALVGFLVPQLVYFPETDHDVTRFSTAAFLLVHLGNGLALGLLIARCRAGPVRRWLARLVAAAVLATILSPVLFTARWMGLGLVPVPPDTPAADQEAAGWLRAHLPSGQRVLTEARDPEWAPARVVELGGHFAPFLVERGRPERRDEFVRAARTLDPELLARLRITYLYATPGFYADLTESGRTALADSERFTLLYTRGSSSEDPDWRAVYAVRPTSGDRRPAERRADG